MLRSLQKSKDEKTVYPVIAGMAIGNPQYRCTQDEALAVASKCPGLPSIKPVLERIYGNSRIGSRYFAIPDFTPSQAAKGDPMFFPADGSYEVGFWFVGDFVCWPLVGAARMGCCSFAVAMVSVGTWYLTAIIALLAGTCLQQSLCRGCRWLMVRDPTQHVPMSMIFTPDDDFGGRGQRHYGRNLYLYLSIPLPVAGGGRI